MNRWRQLSYEELVARVRQFAFLIAGVILSGAGTFEAIQQLTAPSGKFELTRFIAAIVLAGVLPYGVVLSFLGFGPLGSNGKSK